MKKNVYVRCPRCELNYILKKDKFCNVCKSEMQATNERYEELNLELCPVCHINFLNGDEQICEACREEGNFIEYDEEEKEWRRYIGEEDEIESEDEELGENASVIDMDDDNLDYDDDFLDFGKGLGEGIPSEEFDMDEEFDDDLDDEYDDDDDK